MVQKIDAGKNQVSRRAVIDAPVEELFDLIADPHRHHEFDGSGTVGNIVTGPNRMAEGEPFSMKMRMFGMNYRTTSTPTRVRENEVVEWQVGSLQKWRWEFTSLGPNRTEVTETWDVRGVWLAPLYRLAGFFGRNAKGIEKSLKRLQQRYAEAPNISRFGGG